MSGPHATVDQCCQLMAELAPLALAEPWDNVGLLLGDRRWPVRRVMTCLTVTAAVVDEAVRRQVDLLVTHHPLPFKPLGRVTSDTITGRLLLGLIGAQVAVYSAHTAFDSAADGINQLWARRLELQSIGVLVPSESVAAAAVDTPPQGAGRHGRLAQPCSLDELGRRAAEISGARSARLVGAGSTAGIQAIAVACGSGGSFIAHAHRLGCQALITGEATFHACLEAEALGLALVLVGHYASERFAMERLAAQLRTSVAERGWSVEVIASAAESDPLRSMDSAASLT